MSPNGALTVNKMVNSHSTHFITNFKTFILKGPTVWKLKHQDQKFEASLGYIWQEREVRKEEKIGGRQTNRPSGHGKGERKRKRDKERNNILWFHCICYRVDFIHPSIHSFNRHLANARNMQSLCLGAKNRILKSSFGAYLYF